MADQDFVSQFHNIGGDLISERKRNFFKLLKSNSTSLNEEQLQNLQPKTYLESLFQVDIFIHLRLTLKLLDIVKGGNEIFISRIIKERWFFKEAFKSITVEELVNEFLPCTSFAVRMKVLKNLLIVSDESQIDTLFDEVHKRYGLSVAKTLLHGCTTKKFEGVIKENEIVLQPSQVRKLFDKDPELFQKYRSREKEISISNYYEGDISKYVALKNPKLWLEWQKTDRIQNVRLGRRITKKVIANVGDDIVKNIHEYLRFARVDVLVRNTSGCFQDVFLQYFLKTISELTDPLQEAFVLLRYYPKKRRWDLLSQTYLKVYNNSLADNLYKINFWMLHFFEDKSIYHKWAEADYAMTKNTSTLKYCLCEKAIPLIKEKINVTSNKADRSTLIELLVECCAENNDLEALEQVLRYVCSRHRNEDADFHYMCLQKCFLFNWEDLKENHWKYILEELEVFKLKDKNWYDSFYRDTFCDKYLGFLFTNNKPFKEVLEEFVAYKKYSFRTNTDKPELERKILLATIDIILKDGTMNEETSINRKQVLINNIIDFCKQNPDHFINLSHFPSLLAYVNDIFEVNNEILTAEQCVVVRKFFMYIREFPQSSLTIDNVKLFNILKKNSGKHYFYDIMHIFEILIKKSDRSEFEDAVMNYFWNIFPEAGVHDKIITWYFYNEPRTLLPHFDKILTKRLRRAYELYRRKDQEAFFKYYDVKLMTHLTFDGILKATYLKELENIDYLGDQRYCQELMGALCVVMPTEDFTNLVTERLLPKKEKLDMQEKETLHMYNVQCAAAKALKLSPEPVKALPTIMKFCLGDYLQAALTSLYSASYRSPEKALYTYIDVLSKRGVSTRKHVLFLSCELLEYSFVINMLKTIKQKNVSSQKHIFSSTLKYFLKNPSKDLLDLLILNFNTIDKNDNETLESLATASIPLQYRIQYLEKCWGFFESLKKEVILDPYIEKLFGIIHNTKGIIVNLSSDFCRHIITKYFMNFQEHGWNVESSVCKFLMQRKTEQRENFRLVFEILSECKDKMMETNICNFFNEFWKISIIDATNTDDEPDYIELFQQHWLNLFPPLVMFHEYLLLRLLRLKYETKQQLFQNYAYQVTLLFEQLTTEYGPLIYKKFEQAIRQTIACYDEPQQYKFLLNILKVKLSTANCVLVLNLLNKPERNSESWSIYKELLGILEELEEPIVVIHYNYHKLKN